MAAQVVTATSSAAVMARRARLVPMPAPNRLAWIAALGACTALETYALRRRASEATLSEFTRWCFHTQSRGGKATFTFGWCAFALWYLAHINRGPGLPASASARAAVRPR